MLSCYLASESPAPHRCFFNRASPPTHGGHLKRKGTNAAATEIVLGKASKAAILEVLKSQAGLGVIKEQSNGLLRPQQGRSPAGRLAAA